MSVLALGQYFGRVPVRWSAESLALSPVIHEHERVNVAHAHEAGFVALMLDGEYAETAARRSLRYDRFSAFYHPPGVEHQDVIGKRGVRLLMFEFRAGLLEGVCVNQSDLRSLRDLSGTRAAWGLLSLYRDVIRNGDGLEFESRALETIADVVRLSRKIPRDLPALNRTRDYLHAHFRDKVSMRELAALSGIHAVYLGQMFSREFGETVGRHLNRIRVQAAAAQLCDSNLPLAQIALDHGFCDQSHFQRVFRSVTGFTPATFRSQLRDTAASIPHC